MEFESGCLMINCRLMVHFQNVGIMVSLDLAENFGLLCRSGILLAIE